MARETHRETSIPSINFFNNRARLEPSIPSTYFGNCITGRIIVADTNKLMEDYGVAQAAREIGEARRGLDDGVLNGAEEMISGFKALFKGLSQKSQQYLDVMSDGSFWDKSPAEALQFYDLLAEIPKNEYCALNSSSANSLPKKEVTESRHFMEDFDSWSESSSEFGGSEEFTPKEEEVGLVNDVEEVDLVIPQSSEFVGDDEFTAREEREEEVDPLVIEGGVDDSLVEPSELGANAELTDQSSPLSLIEGRAHCPPYDGPIEKSPTVEEWDAEIDYLQSLMDEQDMKYGFESESLIFGDQDFVEEELVEKSNLAEEVLVEESKSTEEGLFSLAASPRFEFYDADFGWGRPTKVELVSIEKSGAFSLSDPRDGDGRIEIGVALKKHETEAFASLFASGPEYYQ
ncbi:hypothetical protein RHMOL_Rhmol10G0064800 [Rhododendron molle]|uniref:Uncharacterized protein n=1 Tax=Rhododendron molle TaxID=49168 RepID=A0ACC0LZG9_RHOML|nr:hypothetical protein RHMOL_Rhmol10G0064800 [Rhododendron molle]